MSFKQWEVLNLEDICVSITDGAHSSPKSVENGYPMASVKDMNYFEINLSTCRQISEEDYLKLVKAKCKPEKNDILIAKDGSYLKHVHVVKEEKEVVILSSIAILKPNIKKICPEFLRYYLLSPRAKTDLEMGYVSGSAIRRIVLKDFKRFPVQVPSIGEQKAIAAILSSLDDKIKLNNQINETLEEMAQALFKRWFVDFEFPNEEGQPYKSSSGEMVESELGMIPRGWNVLKLDDIGEVVAGGTPSTKCQEYYDGNISWITPKDLSGYNRKFIQKGERSITELGLQKSSAKMMPKGSVLFSSRAPIGYITIADNSLCTNQGFKSIVCNEKYMSKNYIYYLLKQEKDKIISIASGSTFKEVSGTTMKNYKIIVPHLSLLEKFENVVKTHDDILKKNYTENDLLTEIRDALLSKLMSGEIRVSDFES